jgi:phage terminase large subunit-like protein
VEKTWGRYIQDVLSGARNAGHREALAVRRHLDDMRDGPARGLRFDHQAASMVIDIIGTLTHTKGDFAGRQIVLEPWQQFIVAQIYGWKGPNGHRRFKTAYVEVPRKNGKSLLAAVLGNVEGITAFSRGDGSPEIYSAATTRDQARIVWEQAEAIVKAGYLKGKHVRPWKHSLEFIKSGGFFKPLAADADTLDGLNPSMVILDEYHAHTTDDLRNVLIKGMTARPEPLFLAITTAGLNKKVPCYQEHKNVTNMLEGRVVNDSHFGIIFTLDDLDDWRDEANWIKASPNLGVSVSWDSMRAHFRDALVSPSRENDFKTKLLNVWTQASTRWLTSETWAKNQDSVDEGELFGRQIYLGVDLSTVRDLSAVVGIVPPEDPEEKYIGVCRFYVPEEGLLERERSEGVPYRAWIEAGYLTATPGPSINYDVIEQDVLHLAENFDVQELAYDPYNAQEIVGHWEDHGIPCVKFPQNIMSQSPALKEFERLHLSGRVSWSGNPVMEYMASSAEVWSDANGNLKLVKPDRRASSSRIDGIAAGSMALYRAVIVAAQGASGSSVYESQEVLVV